MSNGDVGGPRQTIYREAVGRGAGADMSAEKTAFVSRFVRRVRLNSPANHPLASPSRRRLKKGQFDIVA